MRATKEEIKQVMDDIVWWRDRRPSGWDMEGFTGRDYATFISPTGERVTAHAELLVAAFNAGVEASASRVEPKNEKSDWTEFAHDAANAARYIRELVR